MKGLASDVLTAILMGVVVPAVVLRLGAAYLLESEAPIQESDPPAYQTEPPAPETSVPEEEGSGVEILFRREDGTVEPVNLDEYLLGAVLGEMPAYFETEALKAQSVAARTYALRARETGGKHGDGSVCGNYACCQAWVEEQTYLEAYGTDEDVQKIRSCVLSTQDQVLTYDGQLIEATYFSASGGRTEEASAVWGSDVPYLQAVDSPGEEDGYAGFRVTFSREEFASRLGLALADLEGDLVQEVTYTAGGGVDSIRIGGRTFRGTQVRSLLGLRSTIFALEKQEGAISVLTWGFGHRVGMSQYGADAMAVAGKTYQEILAHYYPGTILTQISSDT